jgi:hypothetical protein
MLLKLALNTNQLINQTKLISGQENKDCSKEYIYNIGLLTVNIEFI